jgi:hypothetical protein
VENLVRTVACTVQAVVNTMQIPCLCTSQYPRYINVGDLLTQTTLHYIAPFVAHGSCQLLGSVSACVAMTKLATVDSFAAQVECKAVSERRLLESTSELEKASTWWTLSWQQTAQSRGQLHCQ